MGNGVQGTQTRRTSELSVVVRTLSGKSVYVREKAEAGKITYRTKSPNLCIWVCVLQDEGQGPGFEARVVVLVESMIPRSTWRGPERLIHGSPFRGMSLLHLAAAQGYARLIETLSQWR